MFRPLPPRTIQQHRYMIENSATQNATLCLAHELPTCSGSARKNRVHHDNSPKVLAAAAADESVTMTGEQCDTKLFDRQEGQEDDFGPGVDEQPHARDPPATVWVTQRRMGH